MLQFNDLRITPDGKYLAVEVQVIDSDYLEDVYVDTVCFDIHTNYSSTGPSTKAQYIYKSEDSSESKKKVTVYYDIDTLQDNLFFIYATAKGTPSDDIPCSMNHTTIMGVTYMRYPVYVHVMKTLRALDGCNPPADFLNYLYRIKAFELALEVGNCEKAIEYWKEFFMDKKITVVTKCSCNG